MTKYEDYQHLLVQKKDGVATITINRPEVLNAVNARLHWELSRIWLDIGEDSEVRTALVTGAGRAFCAGGDFKLLEDVMGNPEVVSRIMKEGSDLVYNIINLEKPVVASINGDAFGAGLIIALLADISIASDRARFSDGHVRIGLTAGDHAAIIWPLLSGMAKAKYYLLTSSVLDAKEAERIGLLGLVVPHDQLAERSTAIAQGLASGSQYAIRTTKKALNQWLRLAGHTAFDYSLAMEMLGAFHPDLREGVNAFKEKRAPDFPSAK